MTEIPGSNLEEPSTNQFEQVSLIADHLWALWCFMNGAESYTTTPPGAVVNGQVYLVAPGATGDWSGKDDQVAIGIADAWHYLDIPQEGWRIWVKDENLYRRYREDSSSSSYDESGWIIEASYGSFSLDNGGGTTTEVYDDAVNTNSKILLTPTSANAAVEGIYISAKTSGISFTATHPASPGAGATMDYAIFN